MILKVNNGYTLIELIVVISIMSILTVLVIPSIYSYIHKAKQTQVETNCRIIENHYKMHLIQHNVNHSDLLLTDFLNDNYSEFTSKYSIYYSNDHLYCDETSEDDEIPFI